MSKSILALVVAGLVGTYWLGHSKSVTQDIIRITNKENSEVSKALVSNASPLEPSSKDVINLKLDAKNIVYVRGEIGPESSEVASKIAKLGSNEKESVYVLIDSPGGSVLDGAMILSAMEASKAPVYTVCMQLCASMAAIIHQYGVKRYSVDRSILMFHPAAGGVSGTLEQMQSRLGTIQRYVYKMDNFIAKRANLTLEKFNALTVSELWLDAEDAMKQNFVDGIVSLDLPEEDSSVLKILTDKTGNTTKEKFNFIWK